MDLSNNSVSPLPTDSANLDNPTGRRRPGKKVVEIEYEVASAIRPGKAASGKTSLSKSNSTADSGISMSSSGSPALQHSISSSSRHPTSSYHGHKTHTGKPHLQHAISMPVTRTEGAISPPIPPNPPKSPPINLSPSMNLPEGVYEEPWDLKAKRLKQEQEEKQAKKLLKQQSSEKMVPISNPVTMPVYESAWDSAEKQKKLDEQLNFARSLSTASDADIFHDALDIIPVQSRFEPVHPDKPPPLPSEPPGAPTGGLKQGSHVGGIKQGVPSGGLKPGGPVGGLKPLPTDTYEDAWDIKNRPLDQKIREMQIQASATYEEPWDTKKKQEQLQAKLAKSSIHGREALHAPQTYEEPWDTKKKQEQLQAKLAKTAQVSQEQVHTPATYEEPWDRGRQQEQLKAKLKKTASQNKDRLSHRSEVNIPQQKQKSVDVTDQGWDGADVKGSTNRGKYHRESMDEGRAKSKSKGCNIGQRINPMIPLNSQNWFHGNISRDDAEKMLCVCMEGSYIVRISSDRKSYSLSIKSSKQYIHVQIEELHLLDGSVRYILGKNSKEFPSIPEMIDHYTHHRVPLKGAEHITLLHPVDCKWS